MHQLAYGFDFLVEARGGKGIRMRQPVVGAIREKRKKIAMLIRALGERRELLVPPLTETGYSEHASSDRPFTATMKPAEAAAELNEEGTTHGEGDQFGGPALVAAGAGFGASYRTGTGKGELTDESFRRGHTIVERWRGERRADAELEPG
jgi:hypothetical protein